MTEASSAASAAAPSSETLRVGVTGHRHLASPEDVAVAVEAVLGALDADRLVAVSSLAEGADRIVAERVLATAGGSLHAVLPLEPEDYAADFADPDSRDEFTRLLTMAGTVTLSPRQESREAAYEHAGRAVLDLCDVLLALWDGEPSRGRGGTAQLVAEARALGRPVEVIPVVRAGGKTGETGGKPAERTVERVADAPAP